MTVSIDDLATELVEYILDFLEEKEWFIVESVSRNWQKCVRNLLAEKKILKKLTYYSHKFKKSYKYGQRIIIDDNNIDILKIILTKCPNIKHLDFAWTDVNGKNLIEIAKLCTNLESIDFNDSEINITEQEMDEFGKLIGSQLVKCKFGFFDSIFKIFLKHLKKIEYISFHNLLYEQNKEMFHYLYYECKNLQVVRWFNNLKDNEFNDIEFINMIKQIEHLKIGLPILLRFNFELNNLSKLKIYGNEEGHDKIEMTFANVKELEVKYFTKSKFDLISRFKFPKLESVIITDLDEFDIPQSFINQIEYIKYLNIKLSIDECTDCENINLYLFKLINSLVNCEKIKMNPFHKELQPINLKKLQKLDLRGNNSSIKIESICDFAFYDCYQIECIDLSGNNINCISENAFCFRNSYNTLEIKLCNNKLNEESFAMNSLRNFKRPTKLDLHGNKIKYLNEQVFIQFLTAHQWNHILIDIENKQSIINVNNWPKYEHKKSNSILITNGLCVIINFNFSKNYIKIDKTIDSGENIKNIKEAFEMLNFEVQIHNDEDEDWFTSKTTEKIINDIIRSKEFREHDAFVLYIHSHGFENSFMTSDFNLMIKDDLIRMFRTDFILKLNDVHENDEETKKIFDEKMKIIIFDCFKGMCLFNNPKLIYIFHLDNEIDFYTKQKPEVETTEKLLINKMNKLRKRNTAEWNVLLIEYMLKGKNFITLYIIFNYNI